MSTTLTHAGLPEACSKTDVIAVLEGLGKCGMAISITAFRVLRHYAWRANATDYQAGRICAVWEKVGRTADALALSVRAINMAERELEAEGLIRRTTGGNGARSGLRMAGKIMWAAGVNLAPLIERYAELSARREGRRLHQEAINQCKAEIRHLRNTIRRSSEAESVSSGEAVLPNGRVARINQLERLRQIKDALEAILTEIGSDHGAPNSSDRPEDSCAPNIQNQEPPRICSAMGAQPQVDPRVALELASEDYRLLVEGMGEATWSNLIEASAMTAGWLGISQRAWGKACGTLGRERAALCVLVIDRNARLRSDHSYRARHPARCLAGMIGRAAGEGLNLHGLLRAAHQEDVPGANEGAHDPEADSFAIGAVLGRVLPRISTVEGHPSHE